jgi:hypothetical protein
MQFSRTRLVVFGILLPLADTVRRWHTWREDPMAMFDDYILGAVLLFCAWYAGRSTKGQLVLTAAWGFLCGVGFLSVLGQLRRVQLGEPDPAPISAEWVAIIKGIGLLLAVAALLATINSKQEAPNSATP